MRTVTYKLIDKNKTICLGKVDENNATQVRFDAGNVFDEYPSAVPTLSIINPEGVTYPGIVERDEDMVTWNVQGSDVAVEGTGEIQLAFTSGNTVVRSYIYTTRINRSIVSDDVPDPVDDWLTAAGAALYEIEHITASASGLPAGSDPTASYEDGVITFGIPQGAQGDPGQDGQDGEDGVSPTVAVTTITGGHTVTITDAEGDHAFNVMDGSAGAVIDDTSTAADKVWSASKTNELKSALTLDEKILSSESNVTRTKGINDGLEPGFVNSDGSIYSTGSHSHITISAVGIKSISTVQGSQTISTSQVVGKFNGVYKAVMSRYDSSADIESVCDNVQDGDLLYLNFFGQVYNNPTHTGDYPESYTITEYNRSERFGIKTEDEIKILAKETTSHETTNIENYSGLVEYQDNKFMNADGTTSNGTGHKIVSMSAENVKKVDVTLLTQLGGTGLVLCLLKDKNGNVVTSVVNDRLQVSLDYSLNIPEGYDDGTLYFNWFAYSNETYCNFATITKKAVDFVVRDEFVGKNVYAFGDSIVVGYTSGTTTTENGFMKVFCEQMEAVLSNYGKAGSAFTSGYNNVTTIPAKIQATDLTNADYIIIAGGVNDCQLGVTESDFKDAITALMTWLKANVSVPVIFITPINFSRTYESQIKPLEVYRDYIRLYATINGYKVIDTTNYGFPEGNAPTATALAQLLYGDGLHPTELGHELYGKALSKDVKMLISE